jgi:hypothetical protein
MSFGNIILGDDLILKPRIDERKLFGKAGRD